MVGVGYLIYALAHGFWQAVVGLIVLGLFGSAGGVGFNTYMQHALPAAWMGRIHNVLGPPQQFLALVMMLAASLFTAYAGVRAMMIAMTCVIVAIGGFTAFVVLQARHRSALHAQTPLEIREDV